MRCLAFALVVFGAAGASFAQSPPDHRGEAVTLEPFYRGVTADVDFPVRFHLRNEGGSDGLGLCVITSALMDGMQQGIPALAGGKASEFWRRAKAAPGGYYPEKLERFLGELKATMPDVRWVSWEGVSTDLIEKYTSQGIPVAATMNTGALYGYQSIHHFISVIHLDRDLACIVDNNDPGKYHWMPRSEFDRRFVDGQQGWLFVWLWDAPASSGGYAPCVLLIMGSLAIVASGLNQ